MGKFTRFTALVLALVTVGCCFAACGKKPIVSSEITVTDQAGRTVTLEKKAERVVSCYYITTYAMLSLGLGDSLVGIEKKADTRPIYAMVNPGLLELPGVSTLKEINVEAVASLAPDLVLLPKKLQGSADALEKLGIQTLIVNPETDADLRAMLTLIGTVCGVPEKAQAITSFYDSKIGETVNFATRPSVLFLSNASFLSAAPAGMYQNDLIALGGGVNALGGSTAFYWQEISYEKFLAADPDYIILPAGASYNAKDLAADPILGNLCAVKQGRVLSMPNVLEEWDSPIPSGILGVLWLRSVLHPEVYDNASFRKDVVNFYETFYGFTPAKEVLDLLS